MLFLSYCEKQKRPSADLFISWAACCFRLTLSKKSGNIKLLNLILGMTRMKPLSLLAKKHKTALLTGAVITTALLYQYSPDRLPAAFIHSPFAFIPAKVSAQPPSLLNKDIQITLPGITEGRNSAAIIAKQAGIIRQVSVKEGDKVTAGQLLLSIEGAGAASVPTTEIPAAPPQLSRQAQDDYERAAKDQEKFEKLYAVGAISRKQLEASSARLEAARAALTTSASVGFDPAGAAAAETAGRIIAPVDGTVTALAVDPEKPVQTGQQLMLIDSGGDARVVVHLEQADLYQVHPGTPAEVFTDDRAEPLAGEVEGIFPEAGGNRQTFRTLIRLVNAASLARTGQTVKVQLETGRSELVKAVPVSAVRQEQNLAFIFLAVDGKAIRQPVTLGARFNDLVEVTSHLPGQSYVITEGPERLSDGDRVEIQ